MPHAWQSLCTHKCGCEEGRSEPLRHFKLFKVGLSKVNLCSLKNKFHKSWALRKVQRIFADSACLFSPLGSRRCCCRCCARQGWTPQSCSLDDAPTAGCLLCPRRYIFLHICKQPRHILAGTIWKKHLVSEKVCFFYNPRYLIKNCLRLHRTNQFVHIHEFDIVGKHLCCILVEPEEHLRRANHF